MVTKLDILIGDHTVHCTALVVVPGRVGPGFKPRQKEMLNIHFEEPDTMG